MNVNQKGVKGLIKVIDHCFLPFDDHSPVDLIAMNQDGSIFRIQVKYRSKNTRGRYELTTVSVVNGKRIPINRNFIDGWAIYLADDDRVIFISKKDMEGSVSLSIDLNLNYTNIDG